MPRKPKNQLLQLDKEITRATATILNDGIVIAAENTVKDLQQAGPSWTGLYSNSWQIEIAGQKATGTRRRGEPKSVKGPKLNVKAIRKARSSKDTIQMQIRNLARSKGYAQDERLGRFRRGKAGGKNIGDQPLTKKGQNSLLFESQGRLKEDIRGSLGGRSGGFSSATAELDWLDKYRDGGLLDTTVRLAIDKSMRKVKSKSKFLK